MTVIELLFPAGGRLHTTPWGRHVNEGATEWPPSPWRIQRAFVATWHLKAREDIPRETMVSLMDSLASAAPLFELPPAIQSHTRHYMPTKGGDKTKVFDTFIQTHQPVRIAWPAALDDIQRDALSLLCQRLGYLGRAESIVEATLLPADAELRTANAAPLAENEPVPAGDELVRVLCPETPANHEARLRRAGITPQNPSNRPDELPLPSRPTAKKAAAKRAGNRAAAPVLPTTIFEALHAETGTLQAQGWQQPPGSRWADYTRPAAAFRPEVVRRARQSSGKITVARFVIASSVLPRITQAVSVADRLHKTLVSYADQRQLKNPCIFTGLDPGGKNLTGHRHTHIFCELGEKRDTIGCITLYAPDGYGDDAQAVIEDVQNSRLWGKDGHDIYLILQGFGDENTFDTPLFAQSAKWRSLTPFVSTQHLKTYGDGRPKLDAHGWQQGSAAACLRQQIEKDPRLTNNPLVQFRREQGIVVNAGKTLRCLQFQTLRHGGSGQRGNGDAGAFTIEFEKEIQGPLAFGYGAHFSLGLFVPVPQ